MRHVIRMACGRRRTLSRLEDQYSAGTPTALSAVGGKGVSLRFHHQDDSPCHTGVSDLCFFL
jgi:hypothetical protein